MRHGSLKSLIFAAVISVSASTTAFAANPQVVISTNQGDIIAELAEDKAPKTVANFLRYVDEKFYDKTIFHRVIDGFMIQGGGYTEQLDEKPNHDPIPNEANNGLKNTRGTLAMARTSVPDSATSQFFINVVDNDFLDYKSPTPQGWGYAVFGKVISGQDVVDKIKAVPTIRRGPAFQNLPQPAVVINTIKRVTAN